MADRDVEGLLRWSLACMAPATDEGVTGDVPAPHHDGAHRQHGPDGAASDTTPAATATSTIPSTTPVRDSATTRATTPTRQVD
jgi:hypothetical protein